MDRLLHAFAKTLALIGGVAVAVMMIHVTTDVVLRTLLNRPLFGTVEITSYLYMVALVVLPLATLELTGNNITVDVFYSKFPKKIKVVANIAAGIASSLFFFILFYSAAIDARHALKVSEMAMGSTQLPIWPTRIALAGSFGFIFLCALYMLFKSFVDTDLSVVRDRRESDG